MNTPSNAAANRAANRTKYRVTDSDQIRMGSKLWLEVDDVYNLIPVTVVQIDNEAIDDQNVTVRDEKGQDYDLDLSLGDAALYTHWFPLF